MVSAFPLRSARPTKKNYWEIVDSSHNPQFPTGIKIYEDSANAPPITQWQGYLIQPNLEYSVVPLKGAFLDDVPTERYVLQPKIHSLNIYNIVSGESLSVPMATPVWGQFAKISSQVLGNTYFFEVSGDWGEAYQYQVALPPQSSSQVTKSERRLTITSQESADSVERQFQGLDLPSTFKLVETPQEYTSYTIVRGIRESELPNGAEIIPY